MNFKDNVNIFLNNIIEEGLMNPEVVHISSINYNVDDSTAELYIVLKIGPINYTVVSVDFRLEPTNKFVELKLDSAKPYKKIYLFKNRNKAIKSADDLELAINGDPSTTRGIYNPSWNRVVLNAAKEAANKFNNKNIKAI